MALLLFFRLSNLCSVPSHCTQSHLQPSSPTQPGTSDTSFFFALYVKYAIHGSFFNTSATIATITRRKFDAKSPALRHHFDFYGMFYVDGEVVITLTMDKSILDDCPGAVMLEACFDVGPKVRSEPLACAGLELTTNRTPKATVNDAVIVAASSSIRNWRSGPGKRALEYYNDLSTTMAPYKHSPEAIKAYVIKDLTDVQFLYHDPESGYRA
ncbi:hypothetical protein BD779DRAFT_1676727 [Infundibulicybe gibba]|nr:hypothetical protein BD779DRAFT_1676727 [Infundibulicybe gibba]